MARVLAISSYVAYGHVGLGAIVPALHRLGHEVVAVPTVVLSNHKGYRHCRGFDIDWETLNELLSAVDASGGLQQIDAVLTGYIPSAEVAQNLARAIKRRQMTNPHLVYLCDPVIGDDPGGRYVDEAAAAAIRDALMPLADIATPNRFELAWLTGQEVNGPDDVGRAAHRLAPQMLVATSVPVDGLNLATVLCQPDSVATAVTPRLEDVPRGTGDLLAGLLLGHLLNGLAASDAFARAMAGLAVVIEASLGAPELRLIESLDAMIQTQPLPFAAAR